MASLGFVGLGAGLMGVVWLVTHLMLENGHLREKVRRLEEHARKRIPYGVAEELLDGMAAYDHISMLIDELAAIRDNGRAHFTRALSVGTKREGK